MVMADPYPWPYDGPVDPGRLALVIAGAQRAWQRRSVDPAGTAVNIQRVAQGVRRAGGVIVHVRHAEVGALDLVVDAVGVDGFSGGPLDAELRSRHLDTLVLAGFGAEAAVSSTLRSANDRGYECLTLSDATAPFDDVAGRSSLHSITMSGGIFGAVATSEALLADLAPVPELTIAEAF